MSATASPAAPDSAAPAAAERAPSALSDATLAAIDALFAERIAAGTAPSSVYGLVREGCLVAVRGHAAEGHPVPDADTVFRIASCTKSVTAAAVLLQRDAGLLDLDAPASRYVPALRGLQMPEPDWPEPTVRMLLTMSAGFPTDDPWADRQESLSGADFAALLARGLRFTAAPGTRYEYSNLGYAILGAVVEGASGRPYREVVEQELLQPLALSSTGFDATAVPSERLAAGFESLDGAWRALPISTPGAFSPIGGLASTVTDLARWITWLGEAFRPGEESGPLSRASRRELQQLHRHMPGPPPHRLGVGEAMGYGFGVIVDSSARFGDLLSHSGGYPGYSAHLRWRPITGDGIIAFENATYAGVIRAAAPAFTLLLGGTGATSENPAGEAVSEAAVENGALSPAVVAWPEALEAGRAVERFLRGESTDLAGLFADNVDQDGPLPRRLAAWAAAVAEVGGIAPAPLGQILGEPELITPAELDWRIPGVTGTVRVELLLTPTQPPLVQDISVVAEPARDARGD